MKCDNCGKDLTDDDLVYFEYGLTFNACTLSCFALLRTNVTSSSVKERKKNYE